MKGTVIACAVIALVLLSSCTDEEFYAAMCSEENKDFSMKLFCMFSSPDQVTSCPAREELVGEVPHQGCMCLSSYPLRIDGKCYTVEERAAAGGKVSDCFTRDVQEFDVDARSSCIGRMARSTYDCDREKDAMNQIDYDVCLKATARGASDCEKMYDPAALADCVAARASSAADCAVIKPEWPQYRQCLSQFQQ